MLDHFHPRLSRFFLAGRSCLGFSVSLDRSQSACSYDGGVGEVASILDSSFWTYWAFLASCWTVVATKQTIGDGRLSLFVQSTGNYWHHFGLHYHLNAFVFGHFENGSMTNSVANCCRTEIGKALPFGPNQFPSACDPKKDITRLWIDVIVLVTATSNIVFNVSAP